MLGFKDRSTLERDLKQAKNNLKNYRFMTVEKEILESRVRVAEKTLRDYDARKQGLNKANEGLF